MNVDDGGGAVPRRGLVAAGIAWGAGLLLPVWETTAVAARRRRPRPRPRPQRPAALAATCASPPTGQRIELGQDVRAAQVFVPAVGGRLSRVTFTVIKEQDQRDQGDFRVRIVDAPGAVPTNRVIATSVVADIYVPTGSETFVVATFAGPRIEAGRPYAVVVDRPGSALRLPLAEISETGDCDQFFQADPGSSSTFGDGGYGSALRFSVFVTI